MWSASDGREGNPETARKRTRDGVKVRLSGLYGKTQVLQICKLHSLAGRPMHNLVSLFVVSYRTYCKKLHSAQFCCLTGFLLNKTGSVVLDGSCDKL